MFGLLSGQTHQAMRHMVEIGNGGLSLCGKLRQIQESVKTMGIIQVSGLVETARLEKESGFQTVFDRVRRFSGHAESELNALGEMIRSMAHEAKTIPAIYDSTRKSVGEINSTLTEI